MLSIFCLRLAGGMMVALLPVANSPLNPRFFRTHFLTALGLTTVATLLAWQVGSVVTLLTLGLGLLFAFLGSLVWSLEGAPSGRFLIVLTAAALLAGLVLVSKDVTPESDWGPLLINDLTSAAALGTALTAMLAGHSYLIAPNLSVAPLLRLTGGLVGATLIRLAVAGYGLWSWTEHNSLANLNEVTLWLPVRWGLGFLGPLVLGVMAWQTARIRSTQSATGILYVVVILCFLGELTSQLLTGATGRPL
jgi:hypothetical protein